MIEGLSTYFEAGLTEGALMATIDLENLLGLIDSNKGEIICRDCLNQDDLSALPEEEVITKDKIQGNEKYLCSRCTKEL